MMDIVSWLGGIMVTFEKAKPADAKALALASWKAFDHDIHYGAPSVGGPPGYRSDKWQGKMMHIGQYYKIVVDGQIVGGIIAFPQERATCNLGRIFVHPDYQNQGIGTQAMTFIEGQFPDAHKWTLDTPAWATRNHHFYEKVGYVKVGEEGPADDRGFLYEKVISRPAS
jgi:GNAT superfamily N-acetyltransferase